MRKAALSLLCLALSGVSISLAWGPAAWAQKPPVVVELFTAQGCSSCGKANQLAADLAQRDGVLALTYSVDYWDYLGWKDTFAKPIFAERQRAYAKARGDGAIYTPQVVVNGMIGVNGSNADAIEDAIKVTDEALRGGRIPVRFWYERNSIKIETGDAPAGYHYKDATIWFAVVQKRAEVPIERGDNKGKTLTYTNIVREMLPVGSWNGKAMSLQLARTAIMRPETEAAVVLLQEGKAGPIIGAAWTGLW